MSSFCATVDLGEVGLEDRVEQLVEAATCSLTRAQVVVDVAEVLLDLGVDQPHRPLASSCERARPAGDGPLELQHLALELVDPARRRRWLRRAREDLGLDLVDVVLHGVATAR